MYGRLRRYGLWGELHEESELFAIEAKQLTNTNPKQSKELYAQAARKEEETINLIFPTMPIICESFIISTAALYFKAGDSAESRRIIAEHKDKIKSHYYITLLEEMVNRLDEHSK
ncbi:MAG: hypothetical protein Q8R18_03810 [bacterium]|nr:hypothetical protein [bacterium]